jgi:hypothetical protein
MHGQQGNCPNSQKHDCNTCGRLSLFAFAEGAPLRWSAHIPDDEQMTGSRFPQESATTLVL